MKQTTHRQLVVRNNETHNSRDRRQLFVRNNETHNSRDRRQLVVRNNETTTRAFAVN